MVLQSLYDVVVIDLFTVKFRLCSLHGVRLVLSSFQSVADTIPGTPDTIIYKLLNQIKILHAIKLHSYDD
jgi:hypothetical protein